jgi:hypothetical protein
MFLYFYTMPDSLLLITPPFTQLNTPYPATPYLKGFLNSRGIVSFQADFGIEATLRIFCADTLRQLFYALREVEDADADTQKALAQEEQYLETIDWVIAYMQGNNPEQTERILQRNILPEGARFAQLDTLDWAFGNMHPADQAKHLCTLYLEDLADLIKKHIDPYFGFSRYAERLARSANTFDALYEALNTTPTFVDEILFALTAEHIQKTNPILVAITAPFPGNVYAAFRCAQYIKLQYPEIKIAFGGGFVNTELRSLSDVRVFEFFDFISLDDGEAPLENIWRYLHQDIPLSALKRTFVLQNQQVVFINHTESPDYAFDKTGTPDYSGLPLSAYIQAIEILNPMHSLWSNGRWNKLTMAHGCYWGKCTFCDVSLPYIADYSPLTAIGIVDRIEALMQSTGDNGFHFVDEAAPPALMRDVAIEILRRKLSVRWWTNIRFEKSFTRDLCLLLKASGCVGVSGGLEVASDRLLALINKGVTIEQVTHVLRNFTEAEILVHAYLMYGFPTQTDQETIDSLEIVRQLFDSGVLASAFWHRFAMTAHSPVGLQPEKFQVQAHRAANITFADNDIEHSDPTGGNHDMFSEGLRVSLYNYMQGAGLDLPLHYWFADDVPVTTHAPDYIEHILQTEPFRLPKPTQRLLCMGTCKQTETRIRKKRGVEYAETQLDFSLFSETITLTLPTPIAGILESLVPLLQPGQPPMTFAQAKAIFESSVQDDFELWWVNGDLYKVIIAI